jgi:hypothetical protein
MELFMPKVDAQATLRVPKIGEEVPSYLDSITGKKNRIFKE